MSQRIVKVTLPWDVMDDGKPQDLFGHLVGFEFAAGQLTLQDTPQHLIITLAGVLSNLDHRLEQAVDAITQA